MDPDLLTRLCRVAAFALACLSASAALVADDDRRTFIPKLINTSTVPENGDVNPYGVAFVPEGFPRGGLIAPHDVLVSNFNNSTNLQGTGTTIIKFTPGGELAPPGTADTFFASPLPGLTTALGVLRAGFVVVGNLPTTDGTSATVGRGALQVIDRQGGIVATWTDPVFLDGPWDLTVHDEGVRAQIFVSNVLNGTVVRLDVMIASGKPVLAHKTTLAVGYLHRPDPAALVLGPTGLAYDVPSDTLYVASTADNAIYSIARAASTSSSVHRGKLVFSDPRLRGPLALRFAPNGDLLTANGDAINADPLQPSEIVEFTVHGRFVSEYDVDSSPGGGFGLDVLSDSDGGSNYAAIDDVTNNLSVYKLSEHSM